MIPAIWEDAVKPHVPWKGEQKKIRGQVLVWEPRKPRYNGAQGIYDTAEEYT